MRQEGCPLAASDTPRRERPATSRRRRVLFARVLPVSLLVLCLPLSGSPTRADEPLPPGVEHDIKAHFVYTAAKFVEWPQWAFGGSGSPIVFGVLGSAGIRDALMKQTSGKTLAGRPILVKEFDRLEEIGPCHVLYVAGINRDRLGALFGRLRKWSVLTVGEIDRFAEAGGALNLHLEEGMVRFDLNLEAARLSGLHISSKLAVLGRVIRDGTPRPLARQVRSSGR